MRKFHVLMGSVAACATAAYLPASAADFNSFESACAVSRQNGKVEGAGGFIDNNNNDDGGRVHALGSWTFPIECQYGFQIDAGIGDLAGSTAGGVAGHLFTRDPNSHLLGLYGQWGAVGSQDIWRVGVEAEYYHGNISFEALTGVEDSDRTSTTLFGAFDVAYYANDNLRLSIGYHRFVEVDAVAAGVEWQPQDWHFGRPVSLFVNGGVGDNDYATLYGGLRIYFGDHDKSLIRRHREDDPGAKGIFQLLNESVKKNDPAAPVVTPPAKDDGVPEVL